MIDFKWNKLSDAVKELGEAKVFASFKFGYTNKKYREDRRKKDAALLKAAKDGTLFRERNVEAAAKKTA